MSTAVHAAIAKRFPSPEWAVFYEVRDAAGFNARRSADAVAMNTWPSRGLTVHGIEVKVSRSDWLRELKNPAKSAPVQRFCDRWWVAVSDDSIVKLDELPVTWGLLVLDGKALRTVREAPPLEAEALTRGFVAMVLRNASAGLVPASIVDEKVAERLEKHVEISRGQAQDEAERLKRAYRELAERVDAFEKASGIKIIDRWAFRDPAKLGQVVRSILDGSSGLSADRLEVARRAVDELAGNLDAAIAVVNAIRPSTTDAAAQ